MPSISSWGQEATATFSSVGVMSLRRIKLAVRLLIGSVEGQSRTGICGILRRNAGEGAAKEGHVVGLKVQRVFKAAGLHRQAARPLPSVPDR